MGMEPDENRCNLQSADGGDGQKGVSKKASPTTWPAKPTQQAAGPRWRGGHEDGRRRERPRRKRESACERLRASCARFRPTAPDPPPHTGPRVGPARPMFGSVCSPQRMIRSDNPGNGETPSAQANSGFGAVGEVCSQHAPHIHGATPLAQKYMRKTRSSELGPSRPQVHKFWSTLAKHGRAQGKTRPHWADI